MFHMEHGLRLITSMFHVEHQRTATFWIAR